MAKIILVCTSKSSSKNYNSRNKISLICDNILPDTITPNPIKCIEHDHLAIGIANPMSSLFIHEQAVCMGSLFNPKDQWWQTGEPIPDGTFSLYRFNDEQIEITTDIVGSRHIWYYHDQEIFIASSSQRAIIQYLGSFEPNPHAYPWMLSVGALPTGISWDRRIKRLSSNSKLTLTRNTWETETEVLPFRFDLPTKSDEEYEKDYRETLERSLNQIEFEPSKWILPLSGGFDSRALLLFLANSRNLQAVTWGDPEAEKRPFTDIQVARQLSKKYKLAHTFIPIAKSEEPIEIVLERFISQSEGLTDRLSGYIDGFNLWKQLFEEGYNGYLRGDRAFFTRPHRGLKDIVHCLGIAPLAFYENGKFISNLLADQVLPSPLNQQEGESLTKWKNRLVVQNYIPSGTASLSECKAGFLEVANPLFNYSHVTSSSSLTGKIKSVHKVYRRFILKKSGGIKVASENGNIKLIDIITSEEVSKLIQKELKRVDSQNILPKELLTHLSDSLQPSNIAFRDLNPKKTNRFRAWLKNNIPKPMRKKKRKKKEVYKLDLNIVAFRAFLILKTIKMLEEDAKRIKAVNISN